MVNMKTSVLLFAAVSHVWAAKGGDGDDAISNKDFSGRLAVAFFPDSQGDSCQANDISQAIILSTLTAPEAYTCFNMSDIFSKNSSKGFQRTQDQRYWNLTRTKGLNGVDWKLYNQDLYDNEANYTHTWLRMRKATDGQEGKKSQWHFYQYTLPDCQDVRLGDEESDDVPFSWISCQTNDDGLCKSTAYPIGSFAIYNTRDLDDDECDRWQQFGAAATGGANVGCLLMALVLAVLMVV